MIGFPLFKSFSTSYEMLWFLSNLLENLKRRPFLETSLSFFLSSPPPTHTPLWEVTATALCLVPRRPEEGDWPGASCSGGKDPVLKRRVSLPKVKWKLFLIVRSTQIYLFWTINLTSELKTAQGTKTTRHSESARISIVVKCVQEWMQFTAFRPQGPILRTIFGNQCACIKGLTYLLLQRRFNMPLAGGLTKRKRKVVS